MRRTVPIRCCVGCGERDAQDRLLRFAHGAKGELIPGRGNGRGGYLHPQQKCLQAFLASRSGFVRSLQATVPREARVHYVRLVEQSAKLSS
jgi:predicted RNA-binding protein YlxR (DUF448 family)